MLRRATYCCTLNRESENRPIGVHNKWKQTRLKVINFHYNIVIDSSFTFYIYRLKSVIVIIMANFILLNFDKIIGFSI